MKIVTYKRLSKEDKAKTQHGFDSQQMDIDFFLEKEVPNKEIIGEFQEFVSGAADHKPELEKALELCKKEGATLVIAKLDRLSRRVSQIALLMESGVDFKVSTLPSANNFQLHLYAALAEEERTVIRSRVKRGLQAAKAKGVKLGAASPKYNKTNHVSRGINKAVEAHLDKNEDSIRHMLNLIKTGVVKNEKGKKPRSMADLVKTVNLIKNVSPHKGELWTNKSLQRAMTYYNIQITEII